MLVEVGFAVSVRSAAGTNSVGAFAVAASCVRVCYAGTSIVGPVGGLDAHADNKTNKIIANVMFVFMLSSV